MADAHQTDAADWQSRLMECLPLYGHRNWIVVADAAYPAQSRSGIETILADGDQISTSSAVYRAIGSCTHIRASIYTDLELGFVAENDAPGISTYQRQLDALFAGASRKQIAHEQIIARLDHSAQVFRILIIKTNTTIPYTSVFFELDCSYWSPEAEAHLRHAIEVSNGRGQ
jgi:L-fucose mutarotase/ribose pyranase (RbsD/FucU family)